MRSAKRRASKPVAPKSPVSKQLSFYPQPARLYPNVDYSRITPTQIRELSRQRLARWKSPNYLPPDTPLIRIQQSLANTRRLGRVTMPPGNLINVPPATPNGVNRRIAQAILRGVAFNTSDQVKIPDVSPLAAPPKKKGSNLLECLGRKLRRELVFANGGAGIKRRIVKQRASPNKEKC